MDPLKASDLVSHWLIQTCCKTAKPSRPLRACVARTSKAHTPAVMLAVWSTHGVCGIRMLQAHTMSFMVQERGGGGGAPKEYDFSHKTPEQPSACAHCPSSFRCTAVLPHLRATQKGNLARPHSRSPQAVRKPEGPAMHCHLH